ncbi:hypothetical protein ACP8Y2_23895 [Herpetosiphon llansteffanensis]
MPTLETAQATKILGFIPWGDDGLKPIDVPTSLPQDPPGRMTPEIILDTQQQPWFWLAGRIINVADGRYWDINQAIKTSATAVMPTPQGFIVAVASPGTVSIQLLDLEAKLVWQHERPFELPNELDQRQLLLQDNGRVWLYAGNRSGWQLWEINLQTGELSPQFAQEAPAPSQIWLYNGVVMWWTYQASSQTRQWQRHDLAKQTTSTIEQSPLNRWFANIKSATPAGGALLVSNNELIWMDAAGQEQTRLASNDLLPPSWEAEKYSLIPSRAVINAQGVLLWLGFDQRGVYLLQS